MAATKRQQRLSPSDTRRLIDDYTLYRFGQVLAPADFAKQAGVAAECIDLLLDHKPVPEDDLKKISRSIDVSLALLAEIAGYAAMSSETYMSLNRFFAVVRRQHEQKKARAA